MFPLINLTEEIYKAKQGGKPIDLNHALARCMDAMVLMTNAFNVTDQFRRDRVKPVLPLELQGLTKQPEGTSHDLLFGDDLDARLKEVKEKNQVSEALNTGREGKKRPFEASKKSWTKRSKPSYQGGTSHYSQSSSSHPPPKNSFRFPSRPRGKQRL